MKRKISIFLFSLAFLASCSKATGPEIPESIENETVVVTVSPDIIYDMSAEVKTKSDIESIGSPDILCFAFDSSNPWRILEGYPKVQTEKSGNEYSFILPKLNDGYFVFATTQEDIRWEYTGEYKYTIYFFGEKPFTNKVYCSKPINLNTNTNNHINISAELLPEHYTIELRTECVGFPVNPDDIISDFSFHIGSGDEYKYPEVLEFSTLEEETLENGNICKSFEFTLLPIKKIQYHYIYMSIYIRTYNDKFFRMYDSFTLPTKHIKLKSTLRYDDIR